MIHRFTTYYDAKMRRRSVTGALQMGHLLSFAEIPHSTHVQKWPQPNATSSGRSWHTTHSFVDVVAMAALSDEALAASAEKAASASSDSAVALALRCNSAGDQSARQARLQGPRSSRCLERRGGC